MREPQEGEYIVWDYHEPTGELWVKKMAFQLGRADKERSTKLCCPPGMYIAHSPGRRRDKRK